MPTQPELKCWRMQLLDLPLLNLKAINNLKQVT